MEDLSRHSDLLAVVVAAAAAVVVPLSGLAGSCAFATAPTIFLPDHSW